MSPDGSTDDGALESRPNEMMSPEMIARELAIAQAQLTHLSNELAQREIIASAILNDFDSAKAEVQRLSDLVADATASAEASSDQVTSLSQELLAERKETARQLRELETELSLQDQKQRSLIEEVEKAERQFEIVRVELVAAKAQIETYRNARLEANDSASLKAIKEDLALVRQQLHAVEGESVNLTQRNSELLSAISGQFASSHNRMAETLGGLSEAIKLMTRTPQPVASQQVQARSEAIPKQPLFDVSGLLSRVSSALSARKPAPISVSVQARAIRASGLFDGEWYLSQGAVPDQFASDPLLHFLAVGATEGRDPSPAFSTKYYLENNPDAQASGLNALYHFLIAGKPQGRAPTALVKELQGMDQTAILSREFDFEFYAKRAGRALPADQALASFIRHGWRELRDPHPQFSTQYYLETYPDIKRIGINPYLHYLLSGRREGRLPRPFPELTPDQIWQWQVTAKEFDVDYYLDRNVDVKRSSAEPISHYLLTGWREERDPSPEFSTAYYLDVNPDVREAGVNPYFHYLAEGRREGRSAKRAGSWPTRAEVRRVVAEEFDPYFYASGNPDLLEAGVSDLLQHFLDYGCREGRDPCADFSVAYYLEAYPDVASAGINPFYHFIVAGRHEGRESQHPGGWRAKKLASLVPLAMQVSDALKSPSAPSTVLSGFELRLAMEAEGYDSSKDLLLSLSHDDYTTSVGGVQLCIKLEEEMARNTGVVHLNLHPTVPLPVLSPTSQASSTLLSITCNGKGIGAAYAGAVADAIGAAKPRDGRRFLVVHSLLGHSPEDLISIWQSLKPYRSFFWVHDFFSVCPGYTLLRNGISFCDAPDLQSTACSVCQFGAERESHLDRLSSLFEKIEFEVIAPSEFAADYWKKKSDLKSVAVQVVEHNRLSNPIPMASRSDAPCRVAYIGHPSSHKGWDTFLLLLREFSKDPRYEFHHLGAGPQRDQRAKFSRVSVGEQGASAMIEALEENEIDVALLWSIWPETFSFVTTECLVAGVTVVTSIDSGNIVQLINSHDGGLVLRSEEELVEQFRSDAIEKLTRTRRVSRSQELSRMTFQLLSFAERK
jgi:hypothetical protein